MCCGSAAGAPLVLLTLLLPQGAQGARRSSVHQVAEHGIPKPAVLRFPRPAGGKGHAQADEELVSDRATDVNASSGVSDRYLGGYGSKSMKHLSLWWKQASPWGHGPPMMKVLACVIFLVLVIGPFVLYLLIKSALYSLTHEVSMRSALARAIVKSLLFPLQCLSFLICVSVAIALVMGGITRGFPMIDDFRMLVYRLIECFVWLVPLRIMVQIDIAIEQVVNENMTDQTLVSRKQFMNDVAYGSHIIGPTQQNDDHGYFLFRFIWRPFFYVSILVIVITLLMAITGNANQSFLLATGYILLSVCLAVFGGRTLGPEIYGGLIIFLEKPFREGDIVTLDKMQSQGGAQTDIEKSIVTGFVERIGVRSVTIRRFDMRAVWVPNSLFIANPVANWNTRPRKLIFLEFSVSHRTPIESVKLFQEKVHYLVKNHPQVDQAQYTKAIFRGIDSGFRFILICFNTRGSKKQVVQQDLIFSIVALARKLEVRLTFDQQSLYVEREQVSDKAFYMAGHFSQLMGEGGPGTEGDGLNFDGILPAKKALYESGSAKYAPAGLMVIQVSSVKLAHAEHGDDPGAEGTFDVGHLSGSETDESYAGGHEKRVAYQIIMRMIPAMTLKEWTRLARQSTRSGQWTRRLVVGSKCTELRFFENISFPAAEGRAPGSPLVEVQLFRVGKGIGSWARSKVARLGVGAVRAPAPAEAQGAGPPEPVELLGPGGEVVGHVHAQVHMPEAPAGAATPRRADHALSF